LVKWNTLTKPKKDGGWGIKNIFLFGRALAAKNLWQLLFNKKLWGKTMHEKYFKSQAAQQWIRAEPKSIRGASNV
jgi:hypothetical protein